MNYENAISEVLGAIFLISILVAAFGIFTAIYIPTIIPEKIPKVAFSIACSNSLDLMNVEFPCKEGSFSCYPLINSSVCEKDCLWRDYSTNPNLNTEKYDTEISKCLENCINSICSNLSHCKTLYICHNGGDLLQIDELSIIVNGNTIIENGITSGVTWGMKKYTSDNISNIPPSPPSNIYFENGDSIRILNPSGSIPVNNVMILYSLPSGAKISLVMNQFGTDIV